MSWKRRLATVKSLNADFRALALRKSDEEGLTLETSAFKLFTVLHFKLSW